ncbi:hypothetical protein ACFFX0_24710 [Citricoccus parietis]|uniref:Uncharacterized protein n=1 Tax=Citricoccus parietis TaxID=592307 RepID=A0ABV5G5J1_9MICC
MARAALRSHDGEDGPHPGGRGRTARGQPAPLGCGAHRPLGRGRPVRDLPCRGRGRPAGLALLVPALARLRRLRGPLPGPEGHAGRDGAVLRPVRELRTRL